MMQSHQVFSIHVHFSSNTNSIICNNTSIQCANSNFISNLSSAISVNGSNGSAIITGGQFTTCQTCLNISNNSTVNCTSASFTQNTYDIIQTTASQLILNSCDFEITSGSSDIKIQTSGSGSTTYISGCSFNGNGQTGTTEGTCIQITNNASTTINSSVIQNYTLAIQIGQVSDTSSTQLQASGLLIRTCITDLIQNGSSTITINASTLSSNNITINNPTNTSLNYFNSYNNNTLTIGSTANTITNLLRNINKQYVPTIQ